MKMDWKQIQKPSTMLAVKETLSREPVIMSERWF